MAPGAISRSTSRTAMLRKQYVAAISEIHQSDRRLAAFLWGKIGEKAAFVAQGVKEGNP
jgi:hypothetical protein